MNTSYFVNRPFLLIICMVVAVWSTMPLVQAVPDKQPLVVYDFVPQLQRDFNNPDTLRRHYDEVLLVTCLQAIVNRDEPRLFVRYNREPDDFWFSKMSEPGGWMAGRNVLTVRNIRDLLSLFPDQAKGLVIWDERIPATSDVAATVAGVDDLLAVRDDAKPGSLYQELTAGDHPMKVVRRLLAADGRALFTGTGIIPETKIKSSGSAKNDAYLWLLTNYIETGKTNPRVIGYYIDADWLRSWRNGAFSLHTLNNLDYILAHRGIVCDLDVWEDEAPVDDPNQAPGTDRKTFQKILSACSSLTKGAQMIACHGFVPWAFKYTNFKTSGWNAGGKHEGVATEWHMVEMLSSYNVYVDADAIGYSSLVNASFYEHYPLPSVVRQGPAPTREHLIKDGVLDSGGRLLPVNYYANFQGDYDSAAWLYWQVPKMWDDRARGTMPMSWAMNPNLGDRFRFGLAYVRQTAKPGETWVADEGAGYLIPKQLREPRQSGLPDGTQVWIDHSRRYYQQWDLHATGFEIDGNNPGMDEKGFQAFGQFSPGGVGLQGGKGPGGARFGVSAGVPFICEDTDLPGSESTTDIDRSVDLFRKAFSGRQPNRPDFHMFRSILCKPSFYAAMETSLDKYPDAKARKLVDIPTLMWLIKEYTTNPLSHPPDQPNS